MYQLNFNMKKYSLNLNYFKKRIYNLTALTSILLMLILVFSKSLALGQNLVTYTPTALGILPANTKTPASNVTAGDLTNGGGMTAGTCSSGSYFHGQSVQTTTTANAASGGDYYEFTVAANSGYTATFTSVNLASLRNSSSSSVPLLKFSYKIGSGSFVDDGSSSSAGTGNCTSAGNTYLYNFTDFNTTQTVTFRIYIYGATAATNSYRFGTITVGGSVAAATPTISSSGSLSALSTTYGTASSNTSFSVSGANMTAGILVTPPSGFEVSQSAGSGFGATTTVGAAGTISSTTVYVRLAATTIPGNYSGNIVLSSSGATSVNKATVSSTVNTKSLTISGLTGANKVYDATTTASSTGTAALVGIVGSDVVTISGSPTLSFANANVGTGKTISVSGYSLSGAEAARYSLTQPSLTADITTKSLTITADNVTKTAGALLIGGSGSTAFSSSGLVGGQTIGSVTIAYGSAGATTGDGATPGVYSNQVTPSAATGGTFTASNYSVSYVLGTITVEAAPASPTISVSGSLSGLSTTYGTPSSTTSFTVSGAAMTTGITITPPAGFEVATTSDFSTTIGTNSSPLIIGSAGTIANTTIYVRLRAVASVSGSPYSGNITLTSTGATTENIATSSSTVSTKDLSISGLSAANKTYNALLNVSVSGTPTFVGLMNGEAFSVSGSPTWEFATKTIGTGKTINQTGTYLAPSTNYTVTQPTLTANITTKTLTVSGASAQNKTYDGLTTATITGASLVGVESGDVVSVSGSGTFADANVANGISVTANLSLSGADAGNYTLTQPSGLNANISKANQTITFGAIPTKATTDADFNPGATASSGLTVTYTSSNTSVATIVSGLIHIVGAGTSTITASQTGNSNYNVATSVDQTLTVSLSGYYWNGGSTSANPANGGTGTWTNSNSWRQPTSSGSQTTWSNGNVAILEGTSGNITINSNQTFTTLFVNTDDYSIIPTATLTLTGNIIIANNTALKLNDITSTANKIIGIAGNVSGGANSTLKVNVNQTGSNTSRVNLASSGTTISVPIEVSVGSTSSNYGNFALVATATNTVIQNTISNNSNYKTTIGATSGNSISVNNIISGTADLMFAAGSSGGAGVVTLNAENDYSGATIFNSANSGIIKIGVDNAFPTTTDLTMANSSGNGGILDLNGKNQEIASLTNGAGGGSIKNDGATDATLTISGSTTTTFGLVIADGTKKVNLTRSGAGVTELTAQNTYTGLTTVSDGTLRLNRSAGTTIPIGNNVTISGGILRISTNQTLNNVTVSTGTLRVDSGVTLTINGTFTGGGTIENNGTIMIVGASTFPGSGSTISAMNNLTINRAEGVTLDKSITVTGTLTLTSGTLSIGSNTLTLSGSYPSSNINNIITNSSSILVLNCTGSGPFTLPSFTALDGLTINSSGQNYNLNSNPTISGNITLTNGTLGIGARTLTYSGSSISRTSGVIDASNASASLIFTNSSVITLPVSLFTGSSISNLTINGGGLNIVEDILIPNTLTMTAGNLNFSVGKKIEIGTNASSVGSVSWTGGSVVGKMKRWFSTSANYANNGSIDQASGIFPVGTVDYNRFAQINFTESTPGGYIEMQYLTGAPVVLDEFGAPVSDPYNLPFSYSQGGNQFIQNADATGYWEIKPFSSAGVAYASLDDKAYNLTLRINHADAFDSNPVTANPPGMRIIRAKGNPDGSHDDFAIADIVANVTTLVSQVDFIVQSDGLTGFSWFNIGGDNETPLPVELISFSAECVNHGIEINWSTASEHNSDFFVVEKSTDGENWFNISKVIAAGNSNSMLEYSINDGEKTNLEISYYRLIQFDFDGQSKTFKTISVNCKNEDESILSYPNPSNDEVNLIVVSSHKKNIKIIISDVNGRILLGVNKNIEEGTSLFDFGDVLQQSGVYFITVEDEIGKLKTIRHLQN